MTTLPVIIIVIAACLLGGATGAMWGLSQHRHIYDWLSANIISRMQQAMHSCGYKQDEIDMVTQRMGMRIMPPHIPCPSPPEKEEQAERVEWRMESIVPESEENLLRKANRRRKSAENKVRILRDKVRYINRDAMRAIDNRHRVIEEQWEMMRELQRRGLVSSEDMEKVIYDVSHIKKKL